LKAHGKGSRIPDELINEAVRWRLNQNDCQNRGYVLDGWPKAYENSKDIFYKLPPQPKKKEKPQKAEGEEEEPVQEEEEVDEEEQKRLRTPIFQKDIYPSSVIMLRGSEQQVKEKVQGLPKEKSVGTHWNLSDTERRLKEWNRLNSIHNYKLVNEGNTEVQLPLQRFYQEHETEVFEIDCTGE